MSEPDEGGWSFEDYLEDLEEQLAALRIDLYDNHPNGGPNYAYAHGDLTSIIESASSLQRAVRERLIEEEEEGL